MYNPSSSYPAPMQGYSWAGQPPQTMNPFAAAGTSMIQDYAIMKQQEELRQYQQTMAQPAMMSPMQQARVAYQPQYQFGVMGGQQQMYNDVQRNSSLMGTSFALSAGMMGATWPLFMWGDTVGRGLLTRMAPGFMANRVAGGIAGTIAGGAIGMGVTAPFSMLASHGIERARFASDIQSDIEDYAGRWTGGLGFGRSATKAISFDMMRDMNAPGQFFRAEDQLKIHKMGLASGMVKGRDIGEYKRSFDELKSNAQDIIKMLNTTVEGGMSVMQELQKAGITNPVAMRQQVAQARGIGLASGLGSQNVLSLGAAGAQSTIGTGWNAAVGSTMYQTNAAIVTNMAQNNPYIANAVQGIGGLPNAAAAMSNAAMNVFRSGMGTQVMAAIMDKNNGIDSNQMRRFMRGDMGVFEIASRANSYGMSGGRGGANNRVLFEKYAMRNWNSMNMAEQAGMLKGTFRQWASTRGGEDEASAYAFAKQFTNNSQEAEIFGEMLTRANSFDKMRSGEIGQEYLLRGANRQRGGSLSRGFAYANSAVRNAVNDIADDLYGGAAMLVSGGARALNKAMLSLGLFDTYRGPRQSGELSNRMFGFNSVDRSRLAEASAVRSAAGLPGKIEISADAKSLAATMFKGLSRGSVSPAMRQQAVEMLAESTYGGAGNLWDSPQFMNAMNIKNKSDIEILKSSQKRAQAASYLTTLVTNETRQSNGAAASLQEWKKDPGKYQRELGLYYTGAEAARVYMGQGYSSEEAISMAFIGKKSDQAQIAKRMVSRLYGSTVAGINMPQSNDVAITKQEAEEARGRLGNISNPMSASTRSKFAAVLTAGDPFSQGIAQAAISKYEVARSGPFLPGVKDLGAREAFVRNLSMQKNDDAKKRYLVDYAATSGQSPDSLYGKGWTPQGVIGQAWKLEDDVKTLQKERVGETARMISQNINFIKQNYGIQDSVANMMERVIYGKKGDFTRADLDIIRNSQWGKSQQMNKNTTFENIQSNLIGATSSNDATANNIIQAQNDELKKQLIEVDKQLRGDPGKGGEYTVYGTKYTKDQLEKKKQEIINNIKNEAGQQYTNNSIQSQQTAAPNILNYWNCQWMIR